MMPIQPEPNKGDDRLLLIVGGQSDPNICRLVDQVHLRAVRYCFWDTDLATSRRISWDFQSPELDLDNLSVRPAAIFLRQNVFRQPAASAPANNDAIIYDTAIYDTVVGYALCWPEIVMLNRAALTAVNHKAQNLRLAQQFGLPIPRTLVLADMTALPGHPATSTHIVKPLSGGDLARTIDSVVDDAQWLLSAPPQFVQERLEGENLRIFIVGDQTFAFHVNSRCLDYRSDPAVTVQAWPAPDSLLQPSLALARALGLDYCALDFRCRAGFDEPVFLEVNSAPMFVRFDDACDNRLSDALWMWHLPGK